MPSLTLPECRRYVPPPATKENLEFADLAVIDLSKANTQAGRAELYPQLRDALFTQGFVYAINHGYTQAQRDRIFDIADVSFTDVSPDEKIAYTTNPEEVGCYAGYKPAKFWKVDSDNQIFDQIENYASRASITRVIHTSQDSTVNMDVAKRQHPQALRPFLPELDAFARYNHFNILHPILRLIALSLELPEETFVQKHNFHRSGGSTVTFMKYHRRSRDEEEKSKNVWMKGHGDIGSVTILWSQSVGGLQIMAPDGRWKWVKHIDNALIINTGDMMNFFTGGYYKPTIHRVVQPPEDQRNYDRLGVFFFAMPDHDARLLPCCESPVLQHVGIERQWPDEDAPLCGTWRDSRTVTYGRTNLTNGIEAKIEEEVVEGIVVKHYN